MVKKEKKPEKTVVFNKKIAGLLIFLVGFILIFRFFLLVPLIKLSIRKPIESMAPVKVGIGSVKLSIHQGHINISRIEVFNNDGKNICAIENTEVNIDVPALLKGQVYIPSVMIDGLQAGLPDSTLKDDQKKTSHKKKSGIVAKITDAISKQFSEDALNERFNVKELSRFETSGTLQQIDEATQRVNSLPAKVSQEADMTTVNMRLKKLEDEWSSLQRSIPADIKEYPAYFNKLNTLTSELTSIQQEINRRNQDVNLEIKGTQASIAAIDKQYQKDLKEIDSKLKLVEDIQGSAVERLLGKEVADPLKQLSTIIAKLKTLKKDKKITKESWMDSYRQHGIDVSYPIYEKRPRFLIEKIKIEGWWGKKQSSNRIKGQLSELTSDQDVRGKATTWLIESTERTPEKYSEFSGTYDTRKNKNIINGVIHRANYLLETMYWDETGFPFRITTGNYNVNASLVSDDKGLRIQGNIETSGTVMAPVREDVKMDDVMKWILPIVTAPQSYSLGLSYKNGSVNTYTNIDSIMNKAINNQIEASKKAVSEAVKAEYKKQVGEQLNTLKSSFSGVPNSAVGDLEKSLSGPKERLNRISEGVNKMKDDLKKEQDRVADEVKQKVESGLKDIQKNLPKLF